MVWPGLLPRDESVRAMATRVRRPLLQLLRQHPGEPGVCISHGDPIQAFWVAAERRRSYALHRLQCAKGGLLELTYEDDRLETITYRSPTVIGSSRSEPPLAESGHA
jgi:broad specificity phosphatase PhoE